MSIQTRLAEQKDVMRIAEITQDYEPKNLEGYIDAFSKQVIQNTEKDSCAYIFVAVIDNQIVGHGSLFKYNKGQVEVDFESPEGWYLNGIIVDSRFRRKGVAKELLKTREKFVLENSNNNVLYLIVSAENVPSIEYHKSLGMEEFRRAPGFLKIKLNCGEGILFRKTFN